METMELIGRLAVALGIGLLIGLERGWKERGEAEGTRVAGIRTLALSGLLGGVWGAIAEVAGSVGYWGLGLAFVVYSLGIIVLRRSEIERDHDVGSTTVIAAMLAFSLGAFAVIGNDVVAASAAVTVTLLLASKGALHTWLRRLKWEELRAALTLLAMTVIFLPLLPDRGFGPGGAVNPREIWLMTILIAVVSSVGYLAIKLSGERNGTVLSALAGGLASSTVVTMHMGRLAARHPERQRLFAGGAVLAGGTMMLRIAVVAAVFNPDLLRWLLPPLVAAGLLLFLQALWLLRRDAVNTVNETALVLKSPFHLKTVLGFGLLLAVVMVLARLLTAGLGASGAYALGAVSGLADVDTVTLSMAQLSRSAIDGQVASVAILLAAISNTLSKAVLAWVAGGRRIGLTLLVTLVLAVIGIALGLEAAETWNPAAFLDSLSRLASPAA